MHPTPRHRAQRNLGPLFTITLGRGRSKDPTTAPAISGFTIEGLLLHNDRGGTGAAGGYGIGSTKPVNAILARLARGSNHAGVVAPSAAVALRVGDGDVRHVSGGGCAGGGLLLR
mgnify:CR=1 FL=1